MSFEGDKARLIKELVDAQTSIRAEFGLAPRADPLSDDEPATPPTPGRRTATAT